MGEYDAMTDFEYFDLDLDRNIYELLAEEYEVDAAEIILDNKERM